VFYSSLKDSSHISVFINHRKVKALVDTGAGRTCVSKRIIDKCNLHVEPFKPGQLCNFTTANGGMLNAIGTVTIDYNLNGLIVPFETIVLDNLSESCIFGSDFLDATSARMDFGAGTISFEDGLVVVPVSSSANKINYVRAMSRTVLPPMSESIISVKVGKQFAKTTSLIEPRAPLGSLPFSVAKCLVRPNAMKTVTQILNYGDKPVVLARNQRIAVISRIARDDRLIDARTEDKQTIASINTSSNAQAADNQPINSQQRPKLTEAAQKSFMEDYKFDVNPDLTVEQRDQLINLLYEYRDTFARNLKELGCYKNYEVEIETVPHKPYFIKQYRLPESQKQIAQKLIDEMVDCGLLEPAKKSKYNSSYLLVKKAKGGYRLVIDLRRGANEVSRTWTFNSKSVSEVVEEVASSNSCWYSQFDLYQGYFQLNVAEQSRNLFSITSPDQRRLRLTRLAMGHVNSASEFNSCLHNALQSELNSSLSLYADDISIYSKTFDEHLNKLENVFKLMRLNGLTMSPTKCRVAYPDIKLLGYKVSEKGVELCSSKVQALIDLPFPTSVRSLRRFMGLGNYFRSHIRNFSQRTYHLRQLLKKGAPWNFTKECEAECNDIKQALMSPDVLMPIRPNDDFIIEIDSSSLGYGFIAAQKDPVSGLIRPIYYGSASANRHQERYSSASSELQGLFFACKTLQHWLVGKNVYVYTDSITVSLLKNLHLRTMRERRIGAYLQSFRLFLIHKAGRDNGAADCLSRFYEDYDKAERVKFEADIDEDDLICAIDQQSKPVSEAADATALSACLTDKCEPCDTVVSSHCCDDVNCDHSLCVICHSGDSETEDNLDDDYWSADDGPATTPLQQDCRMALEASAQQAPYAEYAPTYCTDGNALRDREAAIQDGVRLGENNSQNLANNLVDGESVSFATSSCINSHFLNEGDFLSSDERNHVPYAQTTQVQDGDKHDVMSDGVLITRDAPTGPTAPNLTVIENGNRRHIAAVRDPLTTDNRFQLNPLAATFSPSFVDIEKQASDIPSDGPRYRTLEELQQINSYEVINECKTKAFSEQQGSQSCSYNIFAMHRDIPTAGADGRDLMGSALSLPLPFVQSNDRHHIGSTVNKNVDCTETSPLHDDKGARKHSDALTGPQLAKLRGHSESTSMKSDHCNWVDDVRVAESLNSNANAIDFQPQMFDDGGHTLHYNDNDFLSNCVMKTNTDTVNDYQLSQSVNNTLIPQCELADTTLMSITNHDNDFNHNEAYVSCEQLLNQLPTDITNDLLTLDGRVRPTTNSNSYTVTQHATCISAVTTRAQAEKQKQLEEASKTEQKQSNEDMRKPCTDLNETQVYIQQDIPYECQLNKDLKLSVTQQGVSKIQANVFICQADSRLNQVTKAAKQVVTLGGPEIKRQCNEYVKRHGATDGPEVVYTKSSHDKNGELHILHAIQNKRMMQANETDKKHEVTLLYIMAFSLMNELTLETAAIELLSDIPTRDSMIALRDAIDAISLSENGQTIGLSIKHILIMAPDEQQSADIIAALADTTAKGQNTERLDTEQDEEVTNETTQQMQISLKPKDFLEDKYYGDIYRYIQGGILPHDDKKSRHVVLLSESMYIGDDKLLYKVTQPRSRKHGNSGDCYAVKVVPEKYVSLLLQYMHLATGHSQVDQLYSTLRRSFTFSNAYKKTLDHVRGCHRCSFIHNQTRPSVSPLRPIKVTGLFEQLSIDLITHSKSSASGYRNIFVCVDLLSNYTIIVPMRTASAAECLQIFVEKVLPRTSMPISVHVDRGSSFLSVFQEAMNKLGIRLYKSSSRSKQSNGKVERINKIIHQKLRALSANHDTWPDLLPLVESCINFSALTRIGMSPYEIAFGIPPRWQIHNVLETPSATLLSNIDETQKPVFDQLIKRVNDVRENIKQRRERAQSQYEAMFNKKHYTKTPSYTVGDIVYMRKCEERPDKLDVPFHEGEYTVLRVYQSDKYGQLLKLIDAKSGKEVQSLIHPNRLKLAVHKHTVLNPSTNPPVVDVVADKYPVINFQQWKVNEEADNANKTNDNDRKITDGVIHNNPESCATTNSPATQQRTEENKTDQSNPSKSTGNEPERKDKTVAEQQKSTERYRPREFKSSTRSRSNWAQRRHR